MTLEQAIAVRGYHPGSTKARVLCKDYDRMGLLGEQDFAESVLVIEFDFELACSKPKGDKGIDFFVVIKDPQWGTVTRSVNVRTTGKQGGDLICDCNEAKADLFVLAQYALDGSEARCVCWTTRELLKAAPRRLLRGVQWCFIKPRGEMGSIDELKGLIVDGWQY